MNVEGCCQLHFEKNGNWLPKDEALQPLNVKVPSEALYFVQEVLKPALGVSYNAEAVREVLVQLRTCFRLPRFHDLRHTTATLLLRSGVPLVVVQKVLRHRDPKLTEAVYGHLETD